jgi:hypothetical protein
VVGAVVLLVLVLLGLTTRTSGKHLGLAAA